MGILSGRSPSNAWGDVRALLWQHRRRLALGLVLLLASRLAALVLPASSKFFVDEVIVGGRGDRLALLAIVAAGATLVQAAASFGLSRVLSVAAHRAITEVRRRVHAHVTRLPVRYFDSIGTGALVSRVMTDAEALRSLIGAGFIHLVGSLLTAGFALGALLRLNWRLTAAVVAFLSVLGAGAALSFARVRRMFRARSALNAAVTGRVAEMVGGIRIVKAYNAESRERRAFTHGVHGLLRNTARTITGVSAVNATMTASVGVVGIAVMVVGGRAVQSGSMTLGDVVAYAFLAGLLVMPVLDLTSTGSQVAEVLAGVDRIREILGTAREDQDEASHQPVGDLRGEVEFADVTFGYEPGKPVLKHVSFRAPAGSTTALVGRSGAGKSTLVNLVMAFHRPQSGRVLVDGSDLSRLRLRDYRRRLGVVLQDNFLFDGTIAENVRMSRPTATLAEVEAVGRLACCDEFVERLDEGYDTVVGERGVRLSVGQRQRVAIARALLADPRILILDEATSNLDGESERLVQDGLRALLSARTTFVIAHRLSTIQRADQILVLEDGRLVEQGVHRELLLQNGRYRELYAGQSWIDGDAIVHQETALAAGRDGSTARAVWG